QRRTRTAAGRGQSCVGSLLAAASRSAQAPNLQKSGRTNASSISVRDLQLIEIQDALQLAVRDRELLRALLRVEVRALEEFQLEVGQRTIGEVGVGTAREDPP